MKRIVFVCIMGFISCTYGGFADYGVSKYLPKADNYVIPILETLPDSGYVIIGTVWASGVFKDIGNVLPELRKQARKIGADALYQVEFSSTIPDAFGQKPMAFAKAIVYTEKK